MMVEQFEMYMGNLAIASEETEFSVQVSGFMKSTKKVRFQLRVLHLTTHYSMQESARCNYEQLQDHKPHP